MKSVLVFGGIGFLGSSLVKSLLLAKVKVIVFYRKDFGFLDRVRDENLLFINSLESESLKQHKIKTLFHLASKQPANNPSYSDFYDSNVQLTLNVIELAKKLDIEQFIFASTITVFSKSQKSNTITQDSCVNPTNHYSLTKYIAEKIVEIEFASSNVKTHIVRFPSIFGLNSRGGIVETLYKLALKNSDIELYSKGERFRNLIYVESAVEALINVYKNSENLNKHEIFMVGSRDSLALKDITQKLIELTGSNSTIVPVDKFPPSDFDAFIDISKAVEELDFKALSIEEGLKKYVEDMKNESF